MPHAGNVQRPRAGSAFEQAPGGGGASGRQSKCSSHLAAASSTSLNAQCFHLIFQTHHN